jgi:hypothetical protein
MGSMDGSFTVPISVVGGLGSNISRPLEWINAYRLIQRPEW